MPIRKRLTGMVEAALMHTREAHEARLAQEAGLAPPREGSPPTPPPPSLRGPHRTLERGCLRKSDDPSKLPSKACVSRPASGAILAADTMRQRAWRALRRLRMPQSSL